MKHQFYIKINNFTSPWQESMLGIPQGSFISLVLCNLYTSDSLKEECGNHVEFADDIYRCLWNSGDLLSEAIQNTNKDFLGAYST